MFEWMEVHQLNIMLGLSSVCFAVGLFALFTKYLPKRRKIALANLELSAGILLFSDRLAYMYHGVRGFEGYWMVRITNFLVFFMTIFVVFAFNQYVKDLCINEMGLEKCPIRLKLIDGLCLIGGGLVIVSQYTGLYYTFDENNAYQRGPGFIICYAIPFLALIIQMSVLFWYRKRMSRYIGIPVIMFTLIPMLASLFQVKYYGVSLTNMAIVGMGIVLYLFAIMEMNEKLEKAQKRELDAANNKSLSIRRSFEQVVKTIIDALDERDRYTRGHSLRVAEYSRAIAQNMGLDERECFRVYHTAALHAIGRIRIPDALVSKRGHLTEAEEKEMKKQPVYGREILSRVEELPYLSVAAASHHERYDGKGYPEGLKGEAIPLYARIVAVANAYDEMTSFKAGRKPMAQGKVREKLKAAAGGEFDPKIVDIMVAMIDKDTEYMMREPEDETIEEEERTDLTAVKQMHFENYKETVSDGIRISKKPLKICFEAHPDAGFERKMAMPSILLFDSFDSCVHRNERTIRNLHYLEYGGIWMDGHTICTSARDIRNEIRTKKEQGDENGWIRYEIEAVSNRDHVRIRIDSPEQFCEVTVALPDAARYVYFGLTGEHCMVRNISVEEAEKSIDDNEIVRIAPEVDYFTRSDGDLPNVEVDGYREASTQGIPVEEGLRLLFSTCSLPEASLVTHCACIVLFFSEDGTVDGKNYKEYACIRMDGDDATNEGCARNALVVEMTEEFGGWDRWKERNRRGLDYEVQFRRKKNRITFETENAGILIRCTTMLPEGSGAVYAALTGNLCTLMNIRTRFED